MRFARIGISVGALAFGGCTSTVQLPATELPALSTSSMRAASEWPEVRTVAGPTQRIMGNVERIQINGIPDSEPIYAPFSARVNGESLEVAGRPAGPRSFPMTDDLQVSVEYSDLKKNNTVAGCIFIGTGASLFIGGSVLFAVGLDLGDSDRGLNAFQGVLPLMVGVLGISAGLSIAIPGIKLVTTDPTKGDRDTASIQPKLHIGPAGGNLTIKF